MRLIDADVLVEKIWEKHKETEECFDLCVDELKEVYCGIVSTIDEQPTAYDLETVIKQLEEFKAEAEQFNVLGLVTDMIEVVRKGGVED